MSGPALSQRHGPPLPRLREDLVLHESATDAASGRAWLVYDPVKHGYLRIDERCYRLLSLWPRCADASELIGRAESELSLAVTADEIADIAAFLASHQLTLADGDWRKIWQRASERRHGLIAGLTHSYLFFRVPLARPEAFLRATMPLVSPLHTRTAAVLIALTGVAGLYLVSRRWDVFTAQAAGYVSLEGAASFAAVLFAVKVLHELGHAYTALRAGCRVPAMGLAVMMGVPMLYTDVTDAWRLTSRRKRVAIGAAGVVVELGLACVATVVWALTAPGLVNSAAFAVATVCWITSVAINLNPLMRFDGYFILADALGIENLQERSFAFGCWRLREALFKPGAPPPEAVAPRLARFLVAFAWLVWVYRAVLFIGIALLVYAYFFKALGIALFLVEIIYFIAGPLWREVLAWVRLRKAIAGSRRALLTAAVAASVLLALSVPLPSRVEVPAVMQHADLHWLYPPRAADVVRVAAVRGADIAKGDVLVELGSADLERDLKLTAIRLELTRLRLARRTADAVDREESIVLEREQASLASRLDGLEREQRELVVRAPVAGRLVDLNPTLEPGRAVGRGELLALVGGTAASEVKGYVSEAEMERISRGAQGRFIPDDLTAPARDVRLADIAESGAASIDIPDLASRLGGPIATNQDAAKREVPASAQYLVRLAVADVQRGEAASRTVRGVVRLEAAPASVLGRALRHAASVLVRESGF